MLVVHFLTSVPPGGAGLGRDESLFEFAVHPGERIFQRDTVRWWMVVEPVRFPVFEPDLPTIAAFAVETTLVHQPMMVPAEQHEVVEARFTAIRPVFDVMTVDELRVGTAREAATAVAGL